ncbi:MAG TPA: flagellar biosynthesis anti-sigma factor FlgM [Terriglobales bacterium]|jgi:flagellar biosynthesis anti-sigma factor FlgM
MNVRNDIQPILPLDHDIQVAVAATSSHGSNDSTVLANSDQTHLSGAAALASQVALLPDVRTEKVQAVQIAIANGSYSISSTDVAHSLMSHMFGGKE